MYIFNLKLVLGDRIPLNGAWSEPTEGQMTCSYSAEEHYSALEGSANIS
jgi:hypothetical protein